MASLAGMAFLANGNTTSRGLYSEPVRKAVRYVVAQSTPSGLIAGGQAGVDRALTILITEIDRLLGQLGCNSVAELTPALVRSV